MVGLMHKRYYIQQYTLVQEEDWPCSFHREDPHGPTVFLSLSGLQVGSNTVFGERICSGRLCYQTGTDSLAYASLALWGPSRDTAPDKLKANCTYTDKSQELDKQGRILHAVSQMLSVNRYRDFIRKRAVNQNNLCFQAVSIFVVTFDILKHISMRFEKSVLLYTSFFKYYVLKGKKIVVMVPFKSGQVSRVIIDVSTEINDFLNTSIQ